METVGITPPELIAGASTTSSALLGERWGFCPKCGERLKPWWNYCSGCGIRIESFANPYTFTIPWDGTAYIPTMFSAEGDEL